MSFRYLRLVWRGCSFFVLFVSALLAPTLNARATRAIADYILDYWETEDGLPENSATAMVQARDGYLWFGTFQGLVRFDGVQFTVFDPGNTPELPDEHVVNLHLDRKGGLWCSTYKGIARLADGRWTRLQDGWAGDYGRSFAEAPDGTIYVTTFDGHILSFKNERFEEMPRPGDPANGYIGHIDADGFFWVAQNRFTGFWNGTNWIRVAPDVPQKMEFGAGPARDRALWVLQNDVLRKYDRSGLLKEQRLPEAVKGFWSLKESGIGEIWICSYSDGVYRVGTNGMVTRYTMERGLPHNGVRFVFEDREANYWVGTSGGGLMRVKPRTFQTFGIESGLKERIVKTVFSRRNGQVLVGTYGQGAALLDPRTQRAISLSKAPKYVQSALEDSSGTLWLGSFEDGLFRVVTNEAVTVSAPELGKRIPALFEDSRQRLWIASEAEGVTAFESNNFRSVRLSNGEALTRIRAFAEDPASGAILAANDRGLFHMDGDSFSEVRADNGQSIEQIYCIHPLRDGSIWLGTADAGLVRYRAGVLSRVGEEQGFTLRSVTAIVEDGLGQWWLGSKRGIVRVDPARLEAIANGDRSPLQYQLFTVSDGLASLECPGGFQPTAARTPDGRLWFATLKGAAVVDPGQVRSNNKVPPVVLESASFVDAQRRAQTIALPETKKLRLPPGSSQLEVRFTALSFTAPEKVRFSYRLERDKKLLATEETSRRAVSLKLLPPGKYNLQVSAANNDGVWNRDGALLSFTVLPFFWQTLWFRSGALLGFAGLLGALFWKASERRVQIQLENFEQQKALAEEKARLASVLEGTSDLVGFATTGGRVLYINPAGRKLLGLSLDEDVTTLDIRRFYHREALEQLQKIALPAVKREGTWSGEAIMRPRSGHEKLTSQVLLAHKDNTGTISFISAIIRDITESRRLEDQLRDSQKMEALGTLASGIAHDFNNVLSAIIGNIELARVDVGPQHTALESLNEVRKASLRARDLVQQILAFSRQQVHDQKVISLVPVVSEAVKLLRPTLPAGIELVTSISAEAPNVFADGSQIHQVLLNLCTNAWHAMEDGTGRIEIRLDRVDLNRDGAEPDLRPGTYAQLTVRDNGCGMESATLSRIFEPFFTTKSRGRGTGLGLAVVHGIVKNHGGVITVASQPGEGSTFQILFPATTAKPEAAVSDAERALPPHGQGEHILYLDDEAPLVSLATRALQRIGYRVSGFTDANEALAVFRSNPDEFDLVVTDFNMPSISGLEVAHMFLSLRPDLPVLLTSGYLSDELKTNARAAGVAALIYKPNTIAELREAIHRWVGQYRGSLPQKHRFPDVKT